MATEGHEMIDPESQFLMEMRLNSKRPRESEDGSHGNEGDFEWENFKENVKPLKRGRNIKLLNESLKSHSQIPLKQSLLHTRRKLIEAIDEYEGDDLLQPWLQCIKWVQEAFPAAGDSSGLLVIYEQCVRSFWHDDRYRDDLRYLKIWLEYAESCADAEVIYRFLDANKIGQSHSAYYISYALHMESKHKIKTANEIFNQGLSKNAQPHGKLEAAYRKFLARSMTRSTTTDEDVTENNSLSVRGFGTVLSGGENRMLVSDVARKSMKGNLREERIPLSVYKDANVENNSDYRVDISKAGSKPWDTLPTHKDRNKENKSNPAKWTSFKVTQKPGSRLGRVGGAPTIEVFVDEECSGRLHQTVDSQNSSNSLLKERDGDNLNGETELLKQNPLRNFPASSFPR